MAGRRTNRFRFLNRIRTWEREFAADRTELQPGDLKGRVAVVYAYDRNDMIRAKYVDVDSAGRRRSSYLYIIVIIIHGHR